jgi:hypothetical protein
MRLKYSAFLSATLIFLCGNMIFAPLYNAYQVRREAASFEQKESRLIFRIIQTIESSQDRPRVVLLGSSVIAAPFFLIDYDALKPLDYFARNCDVKAMDVSLFAGKPNSVLNMGTDAAMVSDCYFLARKYLVGARKPDVIVVGLTPRDFSDSYPLTPNESMVFRYLTELKDFVWTNEIYLTNFDDVIKFFFNHTVSLFAQRATIQGKVADRLLSVQLKFQGPNIHAGKQSPDTRSFIPDEKERWEASLSNCLFAAWLGGFFQRLLGRHRRRPFSALVTFVMAAIFVATCERRHSSDSQTQNGQRDSSLHIFSPLHLPTRHSSNMPAMRFSEEGLGYLQNLKFAT